MHRTNEGKPWEICFLSFSVPFETLSDWIRVLPLHGHDQPLWLTWSGRFCLYWLCLLIGKAQCLHVCWLFTAFLTWPPVPQLHESDSWVRPGLGVIDLCSPSQFTPDSLWCSLPRHRGKITDLITMQQRPQAQVYELTSFFVGKHMNNDNFLWIR